MLREHEDEDSEQIQTLNTTIVSEKNINKIHPTVKRKKDAEGSNKTTRTRNYKKSAKKWKENTKHKEDKPELYNILFGQKTTIPNNVYTERAASLFDQYMKPSQDQNTKNCTKITFDDILNKHRI